METTIGRRLVRVLKGESFKRGRDQDVPYATE